MRTLLSLLATALLVLGATTSAPAQPVPAAELDLSADSVLASLNRALAWYRQARIVMRSLEGAEVFARADEQTALRLLGRAFDAARAQAALLPADKGGSGGGARVERQAQLKAEVRRQEQEVKQLQSKVRSAPRARRAALERQAVAARHQLELDRARLEFLTRLQDIDPAPAAADDDIEQQIETLREAVPELRSPSTTAPRPAPAVVTPPASRTWGMVQRLLALHQSRNSLEDLRTTTDELASGVNEDIEVLRAAARPVTARLRVLAKDPGEGGMSLADSEREFKELLARRKLLAAAILPLREESALAKRYATDLQGWRRAVDRESRQVLQGLALALVGVAVALAVVLVGGVLWRGAVQRYVTDPARRRLLLTARTVTVAVAMGLVLVFHFTSEIAGLVTVLGFAAAGIAFALQNVILAVAGYFTMAAPSGIRVGDRVSLQGPFGYVHGEVADIGFVRIKLRELAGESLQPTGRTVVFPNSVVFTGSFYKHPPPAGERPIDPSPAG
jgi:hypothetical protein